MGGNEEGNAGARAREEKVESARSGGKGADGWIDRQNAYLWDGRSYDVYIACRIFTFEVERAFLYKKNIDAQTSVFTCVYAVFIYLSWL